MTTPSPEGIQLGAIRPGTRAHAELTRAVRALRQDATDPKDIALYDDILAGRRPARDLVRSEHLNRRAEEGLQAYREELEQLDPVQREAFERQARAEADRLDEPEPEPPAG